MLIHGGAADDADGVSHGIAAVVLSAPVPAALFDARHRYLACSRSWAERIGAGDRDLSGLAHGDATQDLPTQDLPDDWDGLMCRALGGDCVEGPDGWRFVPVRRPDGTTAAVTVFGPVPATGDDMARALRENENRLRLATSALGIGIFEADLDTDDVYMSPEFRSLLGLSETDDPRGEEAWIALLRPSDPEAFRATRDAAFDPAGDGFFTMRFHPIVGGQERAMQTKARVLFAGEGQGMRPVRVIGTLVDETETQRLQEALTRAKGLETVGRLAGTVAHDFNNILTVIQSSLELAALRTRDRDINALLDQAATAAEMGAGLSKRLLSLAGGRQSPPHPVVIDEHIAVTWEVFAQALDTAITLAFDPGSEGAVARISPEELDSALLNLIVNARDAQPQGGRIDIVTSRVTLDAAAAALIDGARPGAFVRISIADRGTGMSPEVARRAKEPFFTTKDIGRGTGLGLTSVVLAAARAEGFVDIRSDGAQGAEVSIWLPCIEDTTESAESGEFPFGDGELVLVVEDDALVREAVMQRLEAIGYSVIEASSAESAMDMLSKGEPVDLVFSDVVMRGSKSGIDLIENVQRDFPELGVLLTSGHLSQRVARTKGQALPADLLMKPYTLGRLARAVARALDDVRSRT